MNIIESHLNFLKMMLKQLTVSWTQADLMSPAEEQMPGGTSAGVELELHREAILDVGQSPSRLS